MLVSDMQKLWACLHNSFQAFICLPRLLQLRDAQCKACKHMRVTQGTLHDQMVLVTLAVPA